MNEDKFNIEMRKFLKKVGITSQREIEKAVREAVNSGALAGNEQLEVSVTLDIPRLNKQESIDGRIALE